MKQTEIARLAGDGIGPEVMKATCRALDILTDGAIHWFDVRAGEELYRETGNPLPDSTIETISRIGLGIKGPTTTPGGGGFSSVNVALRRALGAYAGVRPVIDIGAPKGRPNVALVVYRENEEGLYDCNEEVLGEPGSREVRFSARFSEQGMTRLAQRAFRYATEAGLSRVTVVTKENIHKGSGGLYHEAFNQVAAEFPDIQADHMLVDAMCMRLVLNPEDYQVLVMQNLFGDIISDLCAGLIGGLGVAPGANIGDKVSLFEAVHGSATDIAGRGIANPTALMRSGAMLLEHIGEIERAQTLEDALRRTIANPATRTGDMGGPLGTQAFTDAVIRNF